MSSDSEIDEFYDAEEVTPVKQKSEPTEQVEDTKHEPVKAVDINTEEQLLLEQRRQADERRKAEDEEYKRKLEELHRRKQEEEDKFEASKKAQEAHDRMRKLQQMRGVIVDENTPTRPPPKPPRSLQGGEEDTQHSDNDEAAQKLVDQVYAKTCELTVNLSPSIEYSQSSCDTSSHLVSDSNMSNNLNKQAAMEQKPITKNIPELLEGKADNEMDKLRATPERDSSTPERSKGQEPDIIQITKSKHVETTPGLPVAPPRRKKKKHLTQPSSVVSSTGIQPLTLKGLPVYLPASQGDRLQQNKSLDLHSATFGIRHVTAAEEEDTKGEGHDSVIDLETMSVASSETAESSWSTDVNNRDSIISVKSSTSPAETPKRLCDQHIEEETSIELARVQKSNSLNRTKSNSLRLEKSDSFKERQRALHKEKANSLNREKSGSLKKGSGGKLSKGGSVEKKDEDVPIEGRPRSNSGRFLTDNEILDQVSVLNLDTGECIPLSSAEDKLPRCVNPLALHIMRRTKEYSSDSSLHKKRHDDDEKPGSAHGKQPKAQTLRSVKPFKKRKTQLKKFFSKIKTKAEGRHGDDSSSDEDELVDGRKMIKIKASHSHKGPYDFDLLVPVQELHSDNSGAVWTMKFSPCGKLLAVGGQDNLLRVWCLKTAYSYFDDMRQKYSEATRVSPAPSQDSLNSVSSETSSLSNSYGAGHLLDDEDDHSPFMRRPFCLYKGHTADLLDVSWSKNYFILSSSMDKTVRLWHVSRRECLCCFQHIDFVTAIAFHPKDDRYFLSGSLDGKLRLWNIPEKKVALWNEVTNNTLITAANFCLNGKFAVVGTYDGRCIFYNAEHLKYFTQIHVRSTRGKNARGRKVTGVEPVPGEDKIMVTSNDSRIRLYDLRDLTLTCKYRGCANNSSQIKASFSSNGKYIICGSEDHFVYIWRTQHTSSTARKDRNDFWEGIRAHQHVVTAAIFAPNPGLIIRPQFEFMDSENKEDEMVKDVRGEVLVSADYSGTIKVFINKFKPGSG